MVQYSKAAQLLPILPDTAAFITCTIASSSQIQSFFGLILTFDANLDPELQFFIALLRIILEHK